MWEHCFAATTPLARIRKQDLSCQLMSRRARRRGVKGGGGNWVIALVVIILVMVLAIGVVHTLIRRHLHSEEFRAFLSSQVGRAIGVEGQFDPLRWDGLAVRSDGFHGGEGRPLREIHIEGLQTEIGLGGFWRGVWEVQGFRIRRLELNLDARSPEPSEALAQQPPASSPPSSRKRRGFLPQEVELQGLEVGEVVLEAEMKKGTARLRGMQMRAAPGSGRQTFDVELTGGELTLPGGFLPPMRVRDARMRYQDGAVFINRAEARLWDEGRLELRGEWDPRHEIRALQGELSGVRCEEVVSEDWAKRVSGVLSTQFEVTWPGGEPDASGQMVLRNGVITALPILEVLEAYADTRRFRVLTLSDARADWRWREGQWSLSNLVIASEGLLRLEGELRVVGERLDGNFRLGLAPGTLASIPGAEEHVFLAGERGLRWAPVRVTGTLSEPRHDLAERLIAAAGRRLLEALPEATVEAMLLGKDVVDVSTRNAVQQGFRLIEGGVEVTEPVLDPLLRQGEGILKGVEGLPGILIGPR